MSPSLSKNYYLFLITAIRGGYLLFILFGIVLLEKYYIITGVILSGVLLEFTIIRFIDNWYKHRLRLLDWFRVGTFFTLVLNFITLISFLDSNDTILVNNKVEVPSELSVTVLVIILLGLISLDLGELVVRLKSYFKTNNDSCISLVKRPLLLYIFCAVTAVIQLYLISRGTIGYGSSAEINFSEYSFLIQVTEIAATFLLVTLAIIKYKLKANTTFFNITFVSFVTTQLVFGLLSGMKENIIVTLILIVVPLMVNGYRISNKNLLIIAFSLVLLYPFINNYREIINTTNYERIEAIEYALAKTLLSDPTELLSQGGENYSDRLSLFPMAMYSVHLEEDWKEYKYLKRYVFIPVAWFVPRVILTDKPASDTGSVLYETLTGNRFNSVTPSTYGWSYLEGGVIPLIFAFFIYGVFIALIEQRLNLNNMLGQIIFALLIADLLKVESDIYFRITGALQTIIISFFMYRILIKEKPMNQVYFANNER